MCRIRNEIDNEKVTGYKVALKLMKPNGEIGYFSPSTLVEYKVGKVKGVKRYRKVISVTDLVNPMTNTWFDERHYKKTQLFQSFNGAKVFAQDLCIHTHRSFFNNHWFLKKSILCVKGNAVYESVFHYGSYNGAKCYLVNEIYDLKEVV